MYDLPPRIPVVGGCRAGAAAAPDVKRSAVLILSEDPLAAALIGAAVELVGFEPRYPDDGEAARSALLRTRPPLVLVECDHATACRPSFLGPALMTGARIVLLPTHRTHQNPPPLAARFGLRSLRMPADLESVEALLKTELEAARREA